MVLVCNVHCQTKRHILLTFSRHKELPDNLQIVGLFGFEQKLALPNKIGTPMKSGFCKFVFRGTPNFWLAPSSPSVKVQFLANSWAGLNGYKGYVLVKQWQSSSGNKPT